MIADVVARYDWTCHAFCLMTSHYHLVVRTPNPDLARGMQRLNGSYAASFNRRHGEEGHVFFRRYASRLVQTEAHLLEVFRYVALNPVRAGICRDPADWPWSFYRSVVGRAPRPDFLAADWLLMLFGNDAERARDRFRDFVASAPDADSSQFGDGV